MQRIKSENQWALDFFFLKFTGKPPPTIFFMYDPNKNASCGTLLDCLIVIDELSPVKHSI